MQFSLLSLGNFKSEFENEISPDAVNFGQFATNRRDLDFKKLWRILLRILNFKSWKRILKFKILRRNLL